MRSSISIVGSVVALGCDAAAVLVFWLRGLIILFGPGIAILGVFCFGDGGACSGGVNRLSLAFGGDAGVLMVFLFEMGVASTIPKIIATTRNDVRMIPVGVV